MSKPNSLIPNSIFSSNNSTFLHEISNQEENDSDSDSYSGSAPECEEASSDSGTESEDEESDRFLKEWASKNIHKYTQRLLCALWMKYDAEDEEETIKQLERLTNYITMIDAENN